MDAGGQAARHGSGPAPWESVIGSAKASESFWGAELHLPPSKPRTVMEPNSALGGGGGPSGASPLGLVPSVPAECQHPHPQGVFPGSRSGWTCPACTPSPAVPPPGWLSWQLGGLVARGAVTKEQGTTGGWHSVPPQLCGGWGQQCQGRGGGSQGSRGGAQAFLGLNTAVEG